MNKPNCCNKCFDEGVSQLSYGGCNNAACECHTVKTTTNPSTNDWETDIESMLRNGGVKSDVLIHGILSYFRTHLRIVNIDNCTLLSRKEEEVRRETIEFIRAIIAKFSPYGGNSFEEVFEAATHPKQ